MPAKRLNGEAVTIYQYDVVGEDSETESFFVQHVGLSNEQKVIDKKGFKVHVAHMNPPFKKEGSIPVHVFGTANLTADMIQQIKTFLDEREYEYEAQEMRRDWRKQFVICPHKKDVHGRDKTVIYIRYSCAGFVIESYKEADIDLVNTENLPMVDEKKLEKVYDLSQRSSEEREDWGIGGSGPWTVLLPGYVIHSLERTVEEIRSGPYLPVEGDEIFENSQ